MKKKKKKKRKKKDKEKIKRKKTKKKYKEKRKRKEEDLFSFCFTLRKNKDKRIFVQRVDRASFDVNYSIGKLWLETCNKAHQYLCEISLFDFHDEEHRQTLRLKIL